MRYYLDYLNRTRLKVPGRGEVRAPDPALRPADPKAVPERALLIHIEAFDWNCPQHITPHYTVEELQAAFDPIRQRLAALEAENAALRKQVS